MLLQYLEIAMEDKNLYQMVESILDFLAPRIGYIDGRFLKYVAKLSKFEKTSKDTLKTLQSDEEIKRFAYVKDKNTNVEDNEEKRDKLWKEIIQNRSMDDIPRAHICRTTKASRPILIPNKSQIEIEDILESLENNANKLQTETQNRQLSTSNLETIKKVILKLKEVSKMDL
ncbi:uncharacterized protein LOC129906094 [Episyrphus balteatus]|uniref:uncharacterized protein LOC129906094 n=1 Tax=Episyrphus balteatus TaxID=286459 RepID=UPI0024850FA0|nr:uncharacterized protein LOC129906094 [Episyrphus balteatus]